VTPDPEVLKKAEYQPEFTKPIWEYLATAVSQKRIENGRKMLRQYRSLVADLEKQTGVDRHIIIAIWGMESSYGSYRGKKNVIRSLATLAYSGSRQRFGREQLIGALKILQSKDITLAQMTGSWAGAMGHTQFIPTTYLGYAVDYNGDGRRDIWNTIPDALASTANYLRVSKWRPGETWGYEVELPKGFNFALASRKTVRTLAQWGRRPWAGLRGAQQFSLYTPLQRRDILRFGCRSSGRSHPRSQFFRLRQAMAQGLQAAVPRPAR
jgi:membrane-bound lytic murein transglycosylase B